MAGVGALGELPGELAALGVKRPLIVTDPGLLSTPAFALVREVLGGEPAIFSGVQPNPVQGDVESALAAFQREGCDGTIGFGGGSALDVAKIARPETMPPFIAIPTTAGTGSEVGRSSVIISGGVKRVIFNPAFLARLVILDPRLTAGLPPKLTAATGVDALTHCIESFTSPVDHPLCEAIALEGARLAFENLPGAVAQGENLEFRSKMQIAALMGGIAFQKDLGAAHSLSHPLSAQFGLHHGLANGLCLPAVMKLNAKRLPGVYERLALATGRGRTDAEFIGAVESLLIRIGITGGLRGQGVKEEALDRLAEAAFADSCHKTNPVPVTQADLRELYVAALR